VTGGAPIRVLLVEDSDVYRESLELLLGLEPDVEVVGAVATGGEAAEACDELAAEVVVIDYRLPDVSGTEAASDVRARCPQAAVVFLSASAGEDERVAARSTGSPLVRKDEGVEALVEAVRAAREAAA
jgi:DNA-binding NarL/FixJ family response regulator